MEATPERIAAIRGVIMAYCEGMSLKDALRMFNVCNYTFATMLSTVCELAGEYASARISRSDLIVDEIVDIADDVSIDPQRARNMIDARRWIASKHNARLYGDRIDVNVAQTISINDVLAQARQRVLDMRYPGNVLDAQVIDSNTTSTDVASDNISVPQLGELR